MPCVTAHAFYTQIQQELSHAVLFNMVELTVQSLKAQNIKKAGLLATDGTIAGGVFKESLKMQESRVFCRVRCHKKALWR